MARSSTSNGAMSPSKLDESTWFMEARKDTVRMVDINSFFICKLCKGYLRDAYTIKECLHTFCHGCIRGYYLYNNSCSCPTCNVGLGAKPWTQIIPDPAMQELAAKLLPDYSEKEEAEGYQRVFYRKLGIKRKQPDTPRKDLQDSAKVSRSLGPSPGHMIQFEMHPQRGCDVPLFLQLQTLKAPCMNTQAHLKIMHLRKYVAKKLKIAKPEEIEVLCKGIIVGPEYSLEFIRRTRWKEDSKMILEYRRQIIAS
ncbi:Polycomb group RING finger protein 5 [Phytophthora boehmeriae]|uniref:Polycomb group RING finger protein 5 n=1 Tax=Phytophthora boehmeriae TaxID=109152 RepID=A0A8T1VE32_9STRA|nr:Polycomb group RING finger protein 5 [Phytophthora boehmeriae]